jgi:hypothetical protein
MPRQRSWLPEPDQWCNLFEWGMRRLRRRRLAVLRAVYLHRGQHDLHQGRWKLDLYRLWRRESAMLSRECVPGRWLLRGIRDRNDRPGLRGLGWHLSWYFHGHVFAWSMWILWWFRQCVLLGQSLHGTEYPVPGWDRTGRTVHLCGLRRIRSAVLRRQRRNHENLLDWKRLPAVGRLHLHLQLHGLWRQWPALLRWGHVRDR